MKHPIKAGVYLVISIALLLLSGAPALSFKKQLCMCVFGVVYLALAVNEIIDLAFNAADGKKMKTNNDKSDKGDDDV